MNEAVDKGRGLAASSKLCERIERKLSEGEGGGGGWIEGFIGVQRLVELGANVGA